MSHVSTAVRGSVPIGRKRALDPPTTATAPSSKSKKGHTAARPTHMGPVISPRTGAEVNAEPEPVADIRDDAMVLGVTAKVSGHSGGREKLGARGVIPRAVSSSTPLPGSTVDSLSQEDSQADRQASVTLGAPPPGQPRPRSRSPHEEGDNIRGLPQSVDGGNAITMHKRSDDGGIVTDQLRGELIAFMESCEVDPFHAKDWIETKPSRRKKICQENFARGIDHFSNSSYVMVANTQIGKTFSFLFLIFKAGLMEGMPSILLTKNNTSEVDRMKTSIVKFNEIVRASWKAVKKAHRKTHPEAANMRVPDDVPLLEVTKEPDEFSKLLSTFRDKENKRIKFVPVFVSLSNATRIEALVEDAIVVKDAKGGDKERADDRMDSICSMLLKRGLVDVEGGGKLKAMIVLDEADQIINRNVDQGGRSVGDDDEDPGRVNKKTAAMFTTPRTVGRLEDTHGQVVFAPCLFDLFTATLDVTATPYSLIFSGRGLKSRTHTRIITGSPSKYGFQYLKRPNWKSKLIDRVQVPHDSGVARMIDDMLQSGNSENTPKRSRFAAVIDKTTRQKVDQRTQALKYAARYGKAQLITSTWSAAGVSVFTMCDNDDEENDDEGSSDSDVESVGEKVNTTRDALTLVHNALNVGSLMRITPNLTTIYKAGTEWQTEEELVSTIRCKGATERETRTKGAVDDAKASAKTTSTVGDGSPVLYMSTEGEWETEESLEARIQGEIEQNTKDLVADALKRAEKSVVAEYKWVGGSYPRFIDRFHKEQGALSNERRDNGQGKVFVNLVLFGKDIMDRGVTVKGEESHECGLTDMYVGLDSHCTLAIQVCGRLCGNNYHDCKEGACPAHGEEEVCPLEKKTLWATKEVHDLHESALNFVSFLVETAGNSGKNALETLEDLVDRVEKAAVERGRALTAEFESDFRAIQLFARKATGGRFAVEEEAKETLARVTQARGVHGVGKYAAPGLTMADRVVVNAAASAQGGAADGGGASARSESEVSEGGSDDGDESESDDEGADGESDDGADGDAAKVQVHEMDDTDYFLPSFTALLNNHHRPESERERLMVDKFKEFIILNMRPPPTDSVFVEEKRRFTGHKDCIKVSCTAEGLKTEVVGDQKKIREKFEAMRVALHQRIVNAEG